jgi:hypothetical protein
MFLLKPFKILPTGYYRLLLIGQLATPLLIATLYLNFLAIEEIGFALWEKEGFMMPLFVGAAAYYFLARLGVWVYDGFVTDREKRKETV